MANGKGRFRVWRFAGWRVSLQRFNTARPPLSVFCDCRGVRISSSGGIDRVGWPRQFQIGLTGFGRHLHILGPQRAGCVIL